MYLQSTSNLGYSNEPNSYMEHTPQTEPLSAINQQFMEINQQFSNLNLQYAAQTEPTAPSSLPYQQYQSLPSYAEQPIYDPYAQSQSSGYDSQQQPASLPSNTDTYGYDQSQTFQPPSSEQIDQPNYDYWNQQQQQQQQQPEPYQSDLPEPEV